MSNCLFLQKNGRYLFRRVVPSDVRDRVKKCEWKISLGSISRAQAAVRAAQLYEDTEFEITRYRNPNVRRIRSRAESTRVAHLQLKSHREEFELLLTRHLNSMLIQPAVLVRQDMARRDCDAPNWSNVKSKYLSELETLKNTLVPDIYIHPRHLNLDEIINESSYNPVLDAQYMLDIKKRYKQTRIDSLREVLSVLSGEETPNLDNFFSRDNGSNFKTLQELLKEYERFKKSNWSLKTQTKFDGISKEVLSILGPHTDINSIDRAKCNDLVRIMEALPPNYSKCKMFKGLSLPDIASKAEAQSLPGRNPKTIKTMVTWLISFFQFAEEEQLLSVNPAKGLKVTQRVKQQGKKNPFNDTELQQLFSAPVFTGCADDEKGWRIAGNSFPRRAKYWIPIIGLHSGMRLNEICQLQIGDLQILPEGPFFSVIDTDGKILKSSTSKRLVPIHSNLVALGIIDWIEEMEKVAAPNSSLFPELTSRTSGKRPSDNFSRWFGNLRDSRGLSKSGKSFHSFRHYMTDRLTEQGIRELTIHRLLGWSVKGMLGVYGQGPSNAELINALEKIEIFDLKHLKVPQN